MLAPLGELLSSGDAAVGRDSVVGRQLAEIITGPGGSNNVKAISPVVAQDTVVVFDWDDTVLPTSWLERVHAFQGAALRPEVQRQLAQLAQLCSQTLSMASHMGTVIFITNSAPGWVAQSCQMFMPQILEQVMRHNIFAKPMTAPLTFKITAFRRECRQYRNVVSVGDGDAERVACLRLTMPVAGPGAGNFCVDSWTGGPRHIKSVKLVELPTCQQLLLEQEMIQTRLADIVAFEGSLDLKTRFPVNCGPKGSGGCALVHFARLSSAPAPSAGLSGGLLRGPDSATASGLKMQGELMSTHFGRAAHIGAQPILTGLRGAMGGVAGGASAGDVLPPVGVPTGDKAASDLVNVAVASGLGPGIHGAHPPGEAACSLSAVTRASASSSKGAVVSSAGAGGDRVATTIQRASLEEEGGSAADSNGRGSATPTGGCQGYGGARSKTPTGARHWKMQGVGDGRFRSPYLGAGAAGVAGGKRKQPVLTAGVAAPTAVLRRPSAPP